MTSPLIQQSEQRGFTLIELLVAKSIIAILIGFSLPMIGFTSQIAEQMQDRPALSALGDELITRVDVWEHSYFQAAQILGEEAALGLEGHVPEPDIMIKRLVEHEREMISIGAWIEALLDEVVDPVDKDLLCLADGSVRSLLVKNRLVLQRLMWLRDGLNAGL